jgi:hypothetical protein
MTQPALPALRDTMRPCRPERNLTLNAQGVSRAVPLPACSLLQQGAQLWRRSGHPGCLVKNVRNSFCTLVCTSFFTLVRSIRLREKQVEISDSESVEKSLKRAGATPLFGFQLPKKFLGSLPPVFFRFLCESHRRTSGEPVIAYAVHPGVHLHVHSASGCIDFKPKHFADFGLCFTHIDKAQSWAGATPLHCHGNRGGRSSPVGIRHKPLAYDPVRSSSNAPNTNWQSQVTRDRRLRNI